MNRLLTQAASRDPYQIRRSPYRGVADSVGKMRELARMGQVDPEIRRYATEVIRQVYPRDYLSEAAALYYDACRIIRYTRDPAHAELLYHPVVTLKQRAADCDDFGILLRAGLGAVQLTTGTDAEFMTVGFDRAAPPQARYTHVFLRIQHPRLGWLITDPVAGPHTREMVAKLRKIGVYKVYPT